MEEITKNYYAATTTVDQFKNQRLNQLLTEYQKNQASSKGLYEHKNRLAKSNYLLENSWRKWLFQKGKGYLVDFDQHERKKLKDCFKTLDRNKCGSIGLDELQQMLLGLGLADGLQDIKRLIGGVDEDQSGKIQFEEFLEMIQDDSKQNEVIVNFFKQLIIAQMQKSNEKQSLLNKLNFSKTVAPTKSQKEILRNNLPFEMIVNQIKRNHILSAMSIGRYKSNEGKDMRRMNKGKQVVRAIQKMDQRRLMRKIRESEFQKKRISKKQ